MVEGVAVVFCANITYKKIASKKRLNTDFVIDKVLNNNRKQSGDMFIKQNKITRKTLAIYLIWFGCNRPTLNSNKT